MRFNKVKILANNVPNLNIGEVLDYTCIGFGVGD